MSRRGRIASSLLVTSMTMTNLSGSARAGEHPHEHVEGTPATPHSHRRAGYPLCTSRLAIPSDDGHYVGGYVGGGRALGGPSHCAQEGTYGWDYSPCRPSGHGIFLNWSHGRRYQGGAGSYATDGPRPLHAITEAAREHAGKE